MAKFTYARNRRGAIQRVPRAWLAEGSPFRGQFTQTPSARQVEERSSEPDETWTVPQLRQYAEQAKYDLTGAKSKADVLSVIAQGRASADNSQEG